MILPMNNGKAWADSVRIEELILRNESAANNQKSKAERSWVNNKDKRFGEFKTHKTH